MRSPLAVNLLVQPCGPRGIVRAQGLDGSAMTHIPGPPAVRSLSAPSVAWPFLPGAFLASIALGTNCSPASPAPIRGPRCHLTRTSIGVAGLCSRIHLLLWKLGPLLVLCPLALLHSCVPGFLTVAWQTLVECSPDLFSRPAERAHGGQPSDAPSVSALGLFAATLPASAFLTSSLLREPRPRTGAQRTLPLEVASRHSLLSVFRVPSPALPLAQTSGNAFLLP